MKKNTTKRDDTFRAVCSFLLISTMFSFKTHRGSYCVRVIKCRVRERAENSLFSTSSWRDSGSEQLEYVPEESAMDALFVSLKSIRYALKTRKTHQLRRSCIDYRMNCMRNTSTEFDSPRTEIGWPTRTGHVFLRNLLHENIEQSTSRFTPLFLCDNITVFYHASTISTPDP